MHTLDTVSFEIDVPGVRGQRIRGRVVGPAGFATSPVARPHVILIHGFKGFMDWGFFPDMARRIAAHDRIAVAFNMSGSGIGADLTTFSEPDAFAANTYTRELRDLDLVRDWIRAGVVGGIDARQGALVGHSRGGSIALLHAAEKPEGVRALVTWAALANLDRFDADTKELWRMQGYLLVHNARTGEDQRLNSSLLDDIESHRARFDLPAACGRLRLPVLLVHGEHDETVPPEEMEALARAIPKGLGRTLLVQGASHTFGVRHPMAGPNVTWDTVAVATLDAIVRRPSV